MRPVCSLDEMAAIEARAHRHVPEPELINRAGAALARVVLARMGGGYGRRAVVVAGKGHNGDDGRAAARHLRRRGVQVDEVDAALAQDSAQLLEGKDAARGCDVVIDAAYGTGFHGRYHAPLFPPGVPVIAADIPSGLSGQDGSAGDGAVMADATVTFGALKPGLLLGRGPELAGQVHVASIGLDVPRCTDALLPSLGPDPSLLASRPNRPLDPSGEVVNQECMTWLVDDHDVEVALPSRRRSGHKWDTAVAVIAGSPGMMGAAQMCSEGAARGGAGMVRLGVPGADPRELVQSEVVASALNGSGWAEEARSWTARCRAVVVGPGLGRSPGVTEGVCGVLDSSPVPIVLDADAINAIADPRHPERTAKLIQSSSAGVVLTPHAAEFARLAGHEVGSDPLASVRDLATRTGAVVLLKGSTTIVAEPGGVALMVTAGSSRLATAGTGDVLTGLIGAFLARGLRPLPAAALAAHVHGRAATMGRAEGLVAGDLPALIADWLSALRGVGL
ncbi:MAG: NAD(P)H-hydrate dehydratase [Acidimicrobiales bacterium]